MEGSYEDFADLIDEEKFELDTAGARLLGRDVGLMLRGNAKATGELLTILSEETANQEQSRLATVMQESQLVGFDLAFDALLQLKKGIEERSN